jgi:hypothetical protein
MHSSSIAVEISISNTCTRPRGRFGRTCWYIHFLRFQTSCVLNLRLLYTKVFLTRTHPTGISLELDLVILLKSGGSIMEGELL